MTVSQGPRGPVRAGVRDTAVVLGQVLGPIIARGVIIRRPRVLAAAERFDLDRRAVRRLQGLRDRYGPGPLLLAIPFREQAVLLSPDHVRRVLDQTPEPFSAASSEKRAALDHFEPEGVLVSTGAERRVRRRLNEAVLDSDRPLHHLAERFAAVGRQEAAPLTRRLDDGRVLAWDDFVEAWFRTVRRVVLGDAARDDTGLTDTLAELRAAANWAFARPKRVEQRDRFLRQLAEHLARAEPGSLAAVMAAAPEAAEATSVPVQQVPQWLFAFDAAAMATFRALALLATHPTEADAARAEVARVEAEAEAAPLLPLLRGCVLESLRLWPTTPAVLRQTTTETEWDGQRLRAGTGMVVYAPYFHRDDRHLPYADRFTPELWLGGQADTDWPLIPFSAGPARCPGRNLVLLVSSTMLAALLHPRHLHLLGRHRLSPDRPLPGTLSPYSLRFRATP